MNFTKKCISFVFVSLLLSSPSIAMMEDKSDNLASMSILISRSSVLNLASCSVDDDYACNIAEAIKGNQRITQVNLNHNKIGNKGIKALAQSFKTMKLTHLELYGNPIDDEGFGELLPSLKEVKSLIHIDLREINIGLTGAITPSDLLKSNPALFMYNPKFSKDVLDEIFNKKS